MRVGAGSGQARTSRAAIAYREWVADYDGASAQYHALVTGLDAAVGMIREALARTTTPVNEVKTGSDPITR